MSTNYKLVCDGCGAQGPWVDDINHQSIARHIKKCGTYAAIRIVDEYDERTFGCAPVNGLSNPTKEQAAQYPYKGEW